MKRKICFILIIALPLIFSSLTAQTRIGGFPFFRSFLDGKMKDVEKPVPNNLSAKPGVDRSNKAELVDELGLQLTTKKSEVGAFYLPGYPFTTDDGLKIEFEYMMYPTPGSTGGITDGITMFLVDADRAGNLEYGAEGAGFGYTYRWTNRTLGGVNIEKQRIKGILGGYLAIALDQKNLKTIRMEGQEQRNGVPYFDTNSTPSEKPTKYNTPSNITIRGAAGPDRQDLTSRHPSGSLQYTLYEGDWGYPVLATRYTGGNSDASNLRNEAGFILNTDTGGYEQGTFLPGGIIPPIAQPFDIAGGKRFESPEEAEYRKAIIKLESNPDKSVGGFKITVAVQHGKTSTTVIENFTFPATLTYIENGLPGAILNDYAYVATVPPRITYTVDTPDELVIGFTAATGTETNYTNVIKNLRITPLYGANTANDDITDHRRGPITIRPLENDLGYIDNGGTPIGSKDYLDPPSFRFWTDEYTCLGEGTFEHFVSGKGRWVYDESTAEALFFPVKGYKGEVSIMYDIKGNESPYDDEKFRSSLATISVTIVDNYP
ncbi:hypothetical protein [uncultured Parabacteroides sp.]|uniref:hypothetical protein n=1 Tax=uncultured Parabacteroides sp. TaxID=512312 RepID=UPI00258A2B60|nr:hypothetical protein [uncultured Parabacteroides sp.]